MIKIETPEDLTFYKLQRPSFSEMEHIVLEQGYLNVQHDLLGSFLRKYSWFLDDYLNEQEWKNK